MERVILLEDLTWVEAEKCLNSDSVVVIPLGAGAKEHGPHLRLDNDRRLAEFLADKVGEKSTVVVAPTVSYFYYPSFIEYPGSISLQAETATRLIVDICMSLARFGPRRFYVLNTGISTIKALEPAAKQLKTKQILLTFTDLEKVLAPTVNQISEQEGGSHADEIETSAMLYIDPSRVDMTKAVKDFDKTGTGRLSRKPGQGFTYSASGVWGDPTLASVEKGSEVVQSLVAGVLSDIDQLQSQPLP